VHDLFVDSFVDSFVHEVRTFDRHLPACGKVDQSEAIFIYTLMQAVLAYRWLMFFFRIINDFVHRFILDRTFVDFTVSLLI
jgi:hypothetical protein